MITIGLRAMKQLKLSQYKYHILYITLQFTNLHPSISKTTTTKDSAYTFEELIINSKKT